MSTFYFASTYNNATKQQLWLETIQNSHDIWCNCQSAFAHLLDCIFPKDHKDRNHTVDYIILRDKQECHSGGKEEGDHGMALGESAATQGENIPTEEENLDTEEDVEGLLAAAAEAERR